MTSTSPRSAATVVLFRPGTDGLEVLLTHRPVSMAFAPDMHVFPGGAVDVGDADPDLVARSRLTPGDAARRLGDGLEPASAHALHVAAIRELFEEAGVLLAHPPAVGLSASALDRARAGLLDGSKAFGDTCRELDLQLATDRLVPLSRWVTPRFVGRRFDTRFFAAELPPDAKPSFVESEVVAHRWLAPSAALSAMADGEIGLWLPTSSTLQQVEHVGFFGAIAKRLGPGPGEPIRLADDVSGVVRVVLPSAGGVPGQTVNAYVVGRRELLVIDPGDPSEAAIDGLIALAQGRSARILGIALTHVDPDHHAGAEALARTLGVPVFGGPAASRSVPFELTELIDGQPLPVGDIALRALATPGHRADHVSFLAPAEGWLLAGDLVGPGPSRALLGGFDLEAWRASLDRVAALGAVWLLSGHGEPPLEVGAAISEAHAFLDGLKG